MASTLAARRRASSSPATMKARCDEIARSARAIRHRGGVCGQASGCPEPEETGDSFAENAELKAAAAARGVRAAGARRRFRPRGRGARRRARHPFGALGRSSKDFGLAMERVHRELEAAGARTRRANFTCALALAAPDGQSEVFEGKVFGTLTWPPRGSRGFGYDPIFVPEGYKRNLRRDGAEPESTRSRTAPAPSRS